ncbi:aquaporin family protein [Aerococcus agrisoli]|uniref:Aquaporin family protein n=1 Tax=Aerococcus agrisoli TaxID=2487350 RepID=A0A3N4H3Y4_9LACT|nr:MIP/aquaporin family protein [Aerococcus agrisoli]RPA59854.1 aquaporin family protein [Aerococcus agrisoli]
MQGFIGELIGTFLLVLLGCGVNAGVNLNKSNSHNSGWIVITMGWAFAVTIGVYASGFLSAAHLNPAVTIAFAVNGSFAWGEVVPYIAGQMVGAILGAVTVWLAYHEQFEATEDKGAILGTFATGPQVQNTVWNLVTEIIGTAVLVIGVMALGANQLADGLNPILVGAIVAAVGLSLGGPTGYAINPARDLGPRIAHAFLPISGKGDSNWSYALVPIVGPIIGAIVAALLYNTVLPL